MDLDAILFIIYPESTGLNNHPEFWHTSSDTTAEVPSTPPPLDNLGSPKPLTIVESKSRKHQDDV